MFVAGIDAHATYSVIAIVSNTGELVQKPVRRRDEPGHQAHADEFPLRHHQRQPHREQHPHDDHGDEAHAPEGLALNVGAETPTSRTSSAVGGDHDAFGLQQSHVRATHARGLEQHRTPRA